VISVGGTSALPLSGRDSGNSFQIEGQPQVPYAQQPNARVRAVMPGYFETMRTPILAGRLISDRDTARSPRVTVVNETMARLFWPGQSAVGKRIMRGEGAIEIVGVVRDVKHYQLDGEIRPEMYVPLTQYSRSIMTIVVRTALAPESLALAARRELIEIDKDVPVAELRTMEELLGASVSRPRLYSALLGIFSAVALLLAAVGIYGVMAYSVNQRTRELGLRMALGAEASSVRGMILRQAMAAVLGGIAFGTAGAFAVTRVMKDLLFGVSPTDPLTFFGASMLLVTVAAAAAYFPARRATRVDPLVALRSE
jgi:putative ABC transport system permease protein